MKMSMEGGSYDSGIWNSLLHWECFTVPAKNLSLLWLAVKALWFQVARTENLKYDSKIWFPWEGSWSLQIQNVKQKSISVVVYKN